MQPRKLWISGFVFLILLLHSAPIVQQLRERHQTFWPIMAWGMFRYAQHPPIETTIWKVIAETESGRRIVVEPGDAGLGHAAFARLYRNPLVKGDTARARELSETLGPVHSESIERLIVEGTQYRVTDGGLEVQPRPSLVYSVGDS